MKGPILPFESSRVRFGQPQPPALIPLRRGISPAARLAIARQRQAHRRGWTVQAYEDHLRLRRGVRVAVLINLLTIAATAALAWLILR